MSADKVNWIFAYGSLMWDPGFPSVEAVPALLHGYHRTFCHYSHRYRGTAARPGLVLALDRGGACRGRAYRIATARRPQIMAYLREREMDVGSYHLRQPMITVPDARVRALAFVMDRGHPLYAGKLSLARTAALIRQGVGERGTARDYLDNTIAHLERLGIKDGALHRLQAEVRRGAGEG